MGFRQGALAAGLRVTRPVSTPRAKPVVRRPSKQTLTIELPTAVFDLLTAAAARRTFAVNCYSEGGRPMTPQELAARVLIAILTRGSIDSALTLFGEYITDGRSIGGYYKDDRNSDGVRLESGESPKV